MAKFSESVQILPANGAGGGNLTLPAAELILDLPGCALSLVSVFFETAHASNAVNFFESDDGQPANRRVVPDNSGPGFQQYYFDVELRARYLHIDLAGQAGTAVELVMWGDDCRKVPVIQTEPIGLATDC